MLFRSAVHLCNNLYLVPFGAIRTPDSEEVEGQYAFRNPRTLVESGTADLLDKKLSEELRESIKTNTLLNPLVCRWVYDESDDTHHPVIVGGERRYRALDFLIRKKELVRDPREPKKPRLSLETVTHEKVTADVAYAVVPCQVY